MLVHNCNNLANDEALYPDQAHAIKEHVSPSQQFLGELVDKKGVNSVWTDLATAQKAVDDLLATKGKEINKWLANQNGSTFKDFRGGSPLKSLGKVWRKQNGILVHTPAGNTFLVRLQRMKGHPLEYIVHTAYPT